MLSNDRPITSRKEDQFERAATYERIVELCTGGMDTSAGATIGLVGPWGSGKTSCLNIARKMLEGQKVTVVEFNPWLRSSAEGIVVGLISEVAGAIEKTKGSGRKKLMKKLKEYRRVINATAQTVHPIFGAVAESLLEGEESPEEAKQKIVETLGGMKLDKPIVVMIDDLDRLEAGPLRALFRAVRLVADFPNIVYVMAFDRESAAQALKHDGGAGIGHDYLDKIVETEVRIQLPQEEQRAQAIREAVAELTEEERKARSGRTGLDEGAGYGFDEVMLELLETPRDVKRFERAVESARKDVPRQVRWEDLLVLEAVRTKLPAVGRIIEERTVHITIPARLTASDAERGDVAAKEAADRMLEAAGRQRIAIEAFMTYLPRVDNARRGEESILNRRGKEGREKGHIAEHVILEAALGRRTNHELQTDLWAAEGCDLLPEAKALGKFLMDEERKDSLPLVVGKMTALVRNGSKENIQGWITTLLEIGSASEDTETYRKCMMEAARAWREAPPESRKEILEKVLETTRSLEGRAQFLKTVDICHEDKRVPWDGTEIAERQKKWLEEARKTPSSALHSEKRIMHIAWLWQTSSGGSWNPWDEPELIMKVLKDCTRTSYDGEGASYLMPGTKEGGGTTSPEIGLMLNIWRTPEALKEAVQRARDTAGEADSRFLDDILEAIRNPTTEPLGAE